PPPRPDSGVFFLQASARWKSCPSRLRRQNPRPEARATKGTDKDPRRSRGLWSARRRVRWPVAG
ncbi:MULTISPECIES: hypothetical protein, partial [Acidithiobacillus]|uniref:hypothetical protein n=1 Tax=Acidithiobacillus TaxID=119977 RepID=UPI001E444527